MSSIWYYKQILEQKNYCSLKLLWLDIALDMTSFNQTECNISEKSINSNLKFVQA